MIFAINGRNGSTLWVFHELEVETNSPIVMDLYTINVVRDLNGDEVQEVIAAHLEERESSKSGHIKIISGISGKTIRTIPTPHREEMFVPIQLVVQQDGTELLLLTTGGQNTAGGVYTIRLLTLMQYTSEDQFTTLFHNNKSGIMVPTVVADVTGDNIPDIIIASFNGTVYAYDGVNATQLWNYTFLASESVSAIVPGHFNHDNIPDFMVKYQSGPGFPVYYYSQTTILDGRNGKPLLNNMMTDSGGSNSLLGGVSISQSFGGDFFLHWQMQCRDRYEAKDAYEFVPDSDILYQARADTCRLRYNTSSVLKLYAIARHIEPPGAVIFSTDDIEVHLNRTRLPKQYEHVSKSPLKHPKLLKKLLENREELKKKVAEQLQIMNYKPQNQLKEQIEQQISPEATLVNDELNGNLKTSRYQHFDNAAENNVDVADRKPLVDMTAVRGTPKDYEADGVPLRTSDDYDVYSESEVAQQLYQPSQAKPIRLRAKYPLNRDIRSDITYNTSLMTRSTNNLSRDKAVSLWDLEEEKEEHEALQAKEESEEIAQDIVRDIQGKKHRRRRRESKDDENTKTETNDWFLSSISSTGVLLKSLNNTKSSIDFAFVLNIRESETYPPLFLPQDLVCVENKINDYKSYTPENQRILYKQVIKQCLNERMAINKPFIPQYESQLIVMRISISCSCRALEAHEVCSELNDVDKQSWAEFMGNNANGFYRAN